MNKAIQDFIGSKNIAVVGYSKEKTKFGTTAYNELKKKGYNVYPVNSSGEVINDVKCFSNLSAIPEPLDAVFVSVKPEKVKPVLDEAASKGIKNVWLQKGAESEEAINEANNLGLNLVSGKCILMYAAPVDSVHKWHAFFVKLFGKY